MKKEIRKILAVGLAFVLAVSLGIGMVVPVAAADYEENDWGEWGLPEVEEMTDVGPIAVAPDGTLYAAVWDDDEGEWLVQKSEDDGYTWDDTELTGLDDIWGISSVVVSPNYAEDEIVYVAVADGDDGPTVWRLEEAGEGDVVALKQFPDGDDVDELLCIDVWTDEDDYNWILAATDEDVYVIRDKLFEDWRPQELDDWEYDGDYFDDALEVAFAPDFDDSELIWCVFGSNDGDYWVTATVSPGQWGQDVGDAMIDVDWDIWLDMDFPDDYDSDPETGDTIVYLALSGGGDTGVWMVEGVDADDGHSNAIDLFDLAGEDHADLTSIAVSGDYGESWIFAGGMYEPTVWVSDDGGEGWDAVDRNPTGDYWTHVIMDADVVWGGSTYDPEESMLFAATWGDESAISRADPHEDGDILFSQVGIIDTCIDDLWDIALHPDFPDESTYFLLTHNGVDTASLWTTANGDEDEPDYVRVICGADGPPGNFDCYGWDGLALIEYAQDASAMYLFGWDDGGAAVIWKSTDDGMTFGSERKTKDDAYINDWIIVDSKTIYAATDEDGFYKTTNSGLSWTGTDLGGAAGADIAFSPDFDDGEGWIAIGGDDGEVYLSDDDGDGFDATEAGLCDEVYVAFDADFDDEDADGYMLIYAAGQGDAIQEGEVADTDDVDWDDLEDDENEEAQELYCVGLQVAEDNALYALSMGEAGTGDEDEADGVLILTDDNNTGTFNLPDSDLTGIVGDFEDGESLTISGYSLTTNASGTLISGTVDVEGDDSGATGTFSVSITVSGWDASAPVSVTYDDLWAEIAAGTTGEDMGIYRLLLHESNSEWESALTDDIGCLHGVGWDEIGPSLWLTPGSNVLWTLDQDHGDVGIWNLEDTLSGQVTLSGPTNGYKSEREDEMRISWNELRGTDDEYEYKYTNVDPDYTLSDTIDSTSVLLTELHGSSEYEWKVRVAPGNPWHSRWSDKWTFFTALGEPPWAPTLYTPGGVWQYSGIDVELMPAFSWESANSADSYQFVLADNAEFTSPMVNEKVPESAYQLDFELDYNSNYFWRVQAYKGTEALSRWSDVGAFTTIMEPEPPPPSPPPPATVTQPAPAPVVIPTPIPPILLWVIVGIGAALIIAVIVLIVRTRRAV
jgi:hypothetical protein